MKFITCAETSNLEFLIQVSVRQLDTANLSDYKVEKSEQGKRVTYSSALHLNLVRCEITFAEDEKVSHAIYKQ
jgi:hypothetical protein